MKWTELWGVLIGPRQKPNPPTKSHISETTNTHLGARLPRQTRGRPATELSYQSLVTPECDPTADSVSLNIANLYDYWRAREDSNFQPSDP